MNKNESLLTTFDQLNLKHKDWEGRTVDELLDEYEFETIADVVLVYFEEALKSLRECAPHPTIKHIVEIATSVLKNEFLLLAVSHDHFDTMTKVFPFDPEEMQDLESNAAYFFSLILIPNNYEIPNRSNSKVNFETPIVLFPTKYLDFARENPLAALIITVRVAFFISKYFSLFESQNQQRKEQADALCIELINYFKEFDVDTSQALEQTNISISRFDGIDSISDWNLNRPIIPKDGVNLN